MDARLTLRAGVVALDSRNVRAALSALAQASQLDLRLTDEGTLALASGLAALDRRALAVRVHLAPRLLTLEAHGGDALVVRWLGASIGRRLHAIDAPPLDVELDALRAHIEAHERRAEQAASPAEPSYPPSLAWLVALWRQGRIEVELDALPAVLRLAEQETDLGKLYDRLLESDEVIDVFLSESEFVRAATGE